MLHIINSLRFGGAEQVVFSLVRELHLGGVAVEVCTLVREGVWEQKLMASGIRVHSLDEGRFNVVKILTRMLGLIRAGNYNIVHAHLWPTLYYLSALRPLLKKPIFVYTEHSTWNRRRGHLLPRMTDLLAYRGYDLVVANSLETRKALQEWLPPLARKIQVIQNGVEFPTKRKRNNEIKYPLSMLVVGRLVREKGIDIAIEALRMLVAEGVDVRLTVVGDGIERFSLEQQAKGLPVVFKGYQSAPDDLMASHDILLVPSRWEGFGLTAVEGALVGIPVIASRVDALKRLIAHGKTGLLFEPEDPSDLSKKIKDIMLRSDLRSALVKRNRRQALRNCTIQDFAKKTLGAYRTFSQNESRD